MSTEAPRSLASRGAPLASPDRQRALLDELRGVAPFAQALADAGLWPLRATGIEVLQVNVGKLCNQTCRHCHVDAGPDRVESMTRETLECCLAVVAEAAIPTVDLTGGAPELHPHFRWFVERAAALGAHVIDRCNLTVLGAPSLADLPDFFAEHGVEVVCSLPHHRAPSTDRQRGDGVFERSIAGLRRLNQVGYGRGDPRRRLVLVTNPVGAFLPGAQASLEREWKRELARRHGVEFDALYTVTNMPISRFLEWLVDSANLSAYMERLVQAFNPLAARGVMCRSMISVGWDGRLHDCDFNQMLDLTVEAGMPRHVAEFDAALLGARRVVVGRHCFGCTAGAGSSCGGATVG
ncbi:MAG: arsenosugar biosynthesis radical SAM (seleno)protein ArsS [bacterium]